MPFEALDEAPRLRGRECWCARLMGIEIVLNENDFLGSGEVDIAQLLQNPAHSQ